MTMQSAKNIAKIYCCPKNACFK